MLYLPPVKDEIILGIDPGYKNGCKCVIIDKYGEMKDCFKFMVSPDFAMFNNNNKNKNKKNNDKKENEKQKVDPKIILQEKIKKNNVTVYY